MTLIEYALLVLAFVAASFGTGLPLARRWLSDPLERLCAAPVLGLTFSFVVTFLLYISHAPMEWFAALPLFGAVCLWLEKKSLQGIWTDASARSALLGWLIVAAWTQFLAMTVVSFSGGAWGGDWLEHHQRAIFFREHVPLRFMFVGNYLLPARPPLVNVVTAGYQAISVPVYACDQVIVGLWSSLAFLVAVPFCRRAGGGGKALAVMVGLFLLNPAFLQNSTFAWTKLPTAFFILAGAHFLLRSLEAPQVPAYFALATAALTSALLAHYSAGPFCAVLVIWWLGWRAARRDFANVSRETLAGLLIALPLLGLWFGWATAAYGVADTFLSNSTVLESGPTGWWAQTVKILSNIRATLIPHPLREVDQVLLWQKSSAGWFRDYFFMQVQVNLFGLMGTGGAIALACSLWRGRHPTSRQNTPLQPPLAWAAVLACVILGIAVHGAPDEWGLAHICLQPLGILGLAVLAAKIKECGRAGLAVLAIGLGWDAAINVGLHYWLQAQPPLPEWLGSRDPVGIYIHHGTAAFNACLKEMTLTRFLSDTLPVGGLAVPLVAMLGAALAWRRSNRAPTPSSPIS